MPPSPTTGLKSGGTKTCAACHQDVFAKFNLNERHRLQEGVLDLHHLPQSRTSPATRERLGGFKQEPA